MSHPPESDWSTLVYGLSILILAVLIAVMSR